jgi:mannose-6-phosphate isomerase-like protein (cupin superfamily)
MAAYTKVNLREDVDDQGPNFNQEEIYVVVNGSMRVKLDDEVIELKQWDAVRVAKETMRGFESGPEGVEIIAIGAPNTGPGDAEVEEGWWSD